MYDFLKVELTLSQESKHDFILKFVVQLDFTKKKNIYKYISFYIHLTLKKINFTKLINSLVKINFIHHRTKHACTKYVKLSI